MHIMQFGPGCDRPPSNMKKQYMRIIDFYIFYAGSASPFLKHPRQLGFPDSYTLKTTTATAGPSGHRGRQSKPSQTEL
jgi:hypothetical protein